MDVDAMKVALACSSWPPVECGVGDYTRQLSIALKDISVSVVEVDISAKASESKISSFMRKIASEDVDIVHMQYPAAGHGNSPLKQFYPILNRKHSVVTVHEFAISSNLRKCYYSPFCFYKARIFSSTHEMNKYTHLFKLRRGFDLVIPIGSNIPRSQSEIRIPRSCCYFGLLMPGKGLEDFVEFAQLMSSKKGWTLSLIGAVPGKYVEYAEDIISRCSAYGVNIYRDCSAEQAAGMLARHDLAYLPFPDGASVKRGSMIACLLNGNVVLTRFGQNTPDWLERIAINVSTPANAANAAGEIGLDEYEMERRRHQGQAACGEFEWPQIAERHIKLYSAILAGR